KREGVLFNSGILQALPAGLGAPRCYGYDEPADGVIWLWLEHIQEHAERVWPLARWDLAARNLGRFNGAYLAGRPLPQARWIGGQRLRTWVERHRPLVARIATAPDNPDVGRWWPQPVVDAILALWEERETFCTALERLPQTFCHGDAIRRNLLTRRTVDGVEEMVGIDWEYAGYYAVGEEVGQTLSVAGAFFDVEPAELPALDEALFTGYVDGLHDAGWRGDVQQVRFAYAAHAALRNAFNAVGAIVPNEVQRAAAQRTYGHTWEELAERRAVLRPFLLDRANEARSLIETF
ncbi:MAG: phosphotransferase, partial [Dehalococcoidia bacterium]